MTRFFVPQQNISRTQIRVTDPDDVHHAKHVLRMRPGEAVEVSDQAGTEYVCEIETIDDELTLRILESRPCAAEPSCRITLYQGYPKAGKLETIIQKCTELGAAEVVPVYMARSVVKDSGKGEKKRERMQKIADEASKQCKRGIIPTVREASLYETILGEFGDPETGAGGKYDLVLVPYEDERGTTLKEALRAHPDAKRVAVVIGPEGGFALEEVEAVASRGGVAVSLGKTILRTETAGPAAVAMILYELEMQWKGCERDR